MSIAKLSDVLVQMAKRNLMVLTDDAPLEQCPERFDGISVNVAINVAGLVIVSRTNLEGS